ncbi:hypothetical protein [Nocardiopsis synnemataformans]|uniref:hypothetical protein n=1 Tax=Nocardiopsis synnemataformans TaxID=61305 RepID=UPI003EC04388
MDPCPPIPHPRPAGPYPIAYTVLGTLPSDEPVHVYDLPDDLGDDAPRHLVAVLEGAEYRYLRAPYAALAARRPDVGQMIHEALSIRGCDPQWWDPAERVRLSTVRRMARIGLVYDWPARLTPDRLRLVG